MKVSSINFFVFLLIEMRIIYNFVLEFKKIETSPYNLVGLFHIGLKIPLTLNHRSDVLNVTQKRLSYAELTFKTSPKR